MPIKIIFYWPRKYKEYDFCQLAVSQWIVQYFIWSCISDECGAYVAAGDQIVERLLCT